MIKVAQFSTKLRCRNKAQGCDFNAQRFRKEILKPIDSQAWWDSDQIITLDFEGVNLLSPGFANEAFAYFGRYRGVSYDKFFKKVLFLNISEVKKETIQIEVQSGTIN